MWNRVCTILWVSVKIKEKRGFAFPVPLNFIDELIVSTADLLSVIQIFFRKTSVPKITSGEKKFYFSPEAIKILLESIYTLLHSIKGYGPYELVAVETEEVRIVIKIL